jgi:hypothetical protein
LVTLDAVPTTVSRTRVYRGFIEPMTRGGIQTSLQIACSITRRGVAVITRNGCGSYVAVNANEYQAGAVIGSLLDNQGYGVLPGLRRERMRRLRTVLVYSALLALLLGDVNTAAGGSVAKPGGPQATLAVSISTVNKRRVIGVARCVNSPLKHGIRGAIIFNDGSTQNVKSPATKIAHTYRYGPPYSVTLTCRGTNGRLASKTVTVDISP